MPGTVDLTLRRDRAEPWGFRLQGGVDFEKALTIVFATDGSHSFNSGLRTGDVIVNIGSLEATLLTHQEAQDSIKQQGNCVRLTVQRSSIEEAGMPGTWKPNVQIIGGPATGPANPGQVYTKTSLTLDQKPQEEHWDVKHNITAKGFPSGGIAPPPAGGISSVSAPATNPQAPGVSVGGFRSVSAPQAPSGGPSAAPKPPGPPQPQSCWICKNPISGVFLQVKGRPLHGECFNCATCQTSLKNVGHFAIGDKIYCQTHARDAQNAMHGITSDLGPAQTQAQTMGLPQGLAQNLAKLSVKPQGQTTPFNKSPPAPPPNTAAPNPPPADWANRLSSNTAGMAGNAEDFTKEFMKELMGGTGV